jgi:hypothetical protein
MMMRERTVNSTTRAPEPWGKRFEKRLGSALVHINAFKRGQNPCILSRSGHLCIHQLATRPCAQKLGALLRPALVEKIHEPIPR